MIHWNVNLGDEREGPVRGSTDLNMEMDIKDKFGRNDSIIEMNKSIQGVKLTKILEKMKITFIP